MAQITRRSFILSAATLTLTGIAGASMPIQAMNYLDTSSRYAPPIANTPKHLNIKLQLVPYINEAYQQVEWQFSTDPDFKNIINQDSVRFTQDSVNFDQDKQRFLNITLNNIPSNSRIFYRLTCKNCDAYEINDLPLDHDANNISNIGLYPTKPLEQTSLMTVQSVSVAERVY